MEWLFQKMIENVGESYSPGLVKQILDHQQETIIQHQATIERLLLFMVIIGFLCAIYVIYTEIRFYKFGKKFKKRFEILE